jgi:trigger factor
VTINKSISRQEHSSVIVTLTVAKDDVRSEYDTILNNYSKNSQLPGFRRGKAPREVLIRKFGEAFKAEAMAGLVEKAVAEAFDNQELPQEERPLPYSTPRLEGEPVLDPDQDFSFSLVYDVFPVINVGVWKGLEVEVPCVELGDEDLNRELELVRERNAIVRDRDEGAVAASGDIVTLDYAEIGDAEIGDAGDLLPGTERQDYVCALGANSNAYHFDDEILGMKKGETKEFEKTYAADDPTSPLAGKTIRLRVSLKALKERSLPDLDDELAQDVDEKFNTLEDLKNNIRETMGHNLEHRLRDIKVNRLLERIVAGTPVDIPESMIRIELESHWRETARNFNTTAEQLKKNMENRGEKPEDIENSWRPQVQKILHAQLIVAHLIEELKLEVGDDELEQEIENMAAQESRRAENIRRYYEAEEMRNQLREQIKQRKFLDLLLAENSFKPGPKENYLDLMSDNH